MRRTLITGGFGSLALLLAGAAFLAARSDTGDLDTGSAAPPFSTSGWETDFSNATVPLDEFMSGGPPKDGIPSIDDPKFVSTEEAGEFLADREPVAVVERGGEVRAYLLQILTWHEIVSRFARHTAGCRHDPRSESLARRLHAAGVMDCHRSLIAEEPAGRHPGVDPERGLYEILRSEGQTVPDAGSRG